MYFTYYFLLFTLITFNYSTSVFSTEIDCGEKKSGYKKISRKFINDHVGENVMVTSRIHYSKKFGFCTEMGCSEDNPCCNACGLSFAKFKKTVLNNASIGCSGNNCNWKKKCTYSRRDRVTIYGEVTEKDVIEVHEHCKAQSA